MVPTETLGNMHCLSILALSVAWQVALTALYLPRHSHIRSSHITGAQMRECTVEVTLQLAVLHARLGTPCSNCLEVLCVVQCCTVCPQLENAGACDLAGKI